MARVHFGLFEFDPGTGELLREGRPVHLQAQPAKVLAMLVSAKGEVVTREALRAGVWGDGTSVDFDRGLNFAITQVRTALGDSADSPTFIRTVPKRGYQFIAPVSEPEVAEPAMAVAPAPGLANQQTPKRRRVTLWLAAAAIAFGAVFVATFWKPRPLDPRLAVARFQNETGDPAFDRIADTVTDSLVASLTTQTAGRYGIIGNAAILRQPRSFQDVDEISAALQLQYLVIGQVKRDGARVYVLAHLIRIPDKTHLTVSRQDVDGAATESEMADRIAHRFTQRLDSSRAATR